MRYGEHSCYLAEQGLANRQTQDMLCAFVSAIVVTGFSDQVSYHLAGLAPRVTEPSS